MQEQTSSEGPVKIFCCYAHTDKSYLELLKTHLMPLQRRGVISTWSDTDISPGTNYEEEISKHLKSAHIILLFISPDFIASDYCFSKELAQILERHQRGEIHVIPIIVRYCSWLETSIGKLQSLPTGAKPISSWLDLDQALLDVTVGIKKVLEELVVKPTSIQEKNQAMLASNRNNAISPSTLRLK